MLNCKKIKIMSIAMAISLSWQFSHALEALDNEALSNTAAQDGLTIILQNIAPNARLIWTDHTGVSLADGVLNPADYGFNAAPSAGALMFGDGTRAGNFRISEGTSVITLDTDAAHGSPFLNINIQLPDDLQIQTGDIFVSSREADGSYSNQTKIMRDMRIDLAGLNMNVQLGSSPQGHLLLAYGVVNDGVKISNIGLIGAESSGQEYGIGMSAMKIKDTGSSNDLTINGASIDISQDGLVVRPSVGKQVDVLMQDLKLGNLSSADQSIGDVALKGLQIGNHTLTITGH